ACIEAKEAGFDGIEAQAPKNIKETLVWKACLEKYELSYIAEIVTGGGYTPRRNASVQEHLDDFQSALEASQRLSPLFVTCIGGCDAWSEEQSLLFFESALHVAQKAHCVVSFETHRSRTLFNPWVTKRMVEKLPALKLTLDLSHWCVVCERRMDTELETMQALSSHVHHIHARVGYDQGPQVPHPAAPEYKEDVKVHQQCWEIVWKAQRLQGYQSTTMTPEFGPDGYLHTLPFTQAPVADLWEINCWMAVQERQHFKTFITTLEKQ
ncbi:MAG: TIM barrel protein, partial [Sulfurospirillaceae bacterium]|nr:TIM barrel protein [Sulfurospirillaceae bacterium]